MSNDERQKIIKLRATLFGKPVAVVVKGSDLEILPFVNREKLEKYEIRWTGPADKFFQDDNNVPRVFGAVSADELYQKVLGAPQRAEKRLVEIENALLGLSSTYTITSVKDSANEATECLLWVPSDSERRAHRAKLADLFDLAK
jgi:hypothetical protein